MNKHGFLKLFKLDLFGNVSQVTNLQNDQSIDDNAIAKVAFNDEVYFRGHDLNSLAKFFKVDSSGIVTQVTNIANGGNDEPDSATVFNNALYFASQNANGVYKLYKLSYE